MSRRDDLAELLRGYGAVESGVADESKGRPVFETSVSVTVMSKMSVTEAVPSLAVTFTDTVPASLNCEAPVNVRVAASKVNHDGNALPSANVAV